MRKLAGLLALVVGCSDRPVPVAVQPPAPRVVAQEKPPVKAVNHKPPVMFDCASHLWDVYGGNIVAADERCTGATVEIKSTEENDIKKDEVSGRYYIAGYVLSLPHYNQSPALYFYLTPESAKKVSTANGGDAFHVRGRCVGREDDPLAWKGYRVTLEDCEVIATLRFDAAAKKWVEKR